MVVPIWRRRSKELSRQNRLFVAAHKHKCDYGPLFIQAKVFSFSPKNARTPNLRGRGRFEVDFGLG